MRCYLDTNIFLRFLIAEDTPAHTSCQELFRLIEARRVKSMTSPLVFAEIVWVLGSFYKFPRGKISDALSVLARSGILFDNRFDITAAIDFYGSHTVKFVDALIASHPLIRSGKLPIVSYDADFDKLKIKRMEPDDVIARINRA